MSSEAQEPRLCHCECTADELRCHPAAPVAQEPPAPAEVDYDALWGPAVERLRPLPAPTTLVVTSDDLRLAFQRNLDAITGDDLASQAARRSIQAALQTITDPPAQLREWKQGDSLILPPADQSSYEPGSVLPPAPGSAQAPADPDWLTEAIDTAWGFLGNDPDDDPTAAIRAALPILRAGIEQEVRKKVCEDILAVRDEGVPAWESSAPRDTDETVLDGLTYASRIALGNGKSS